MSACVLYADDRWLDTLRVMEEWRATPTLYGHSVTRRGGVKGTG